MRLFLILLENTAGKRDWLNVQAAHGTGDLVTENWACSVEKGRSTESAYILADSQSLSRALVENN